MLISETVSSSTVAGMFRDIAVPVMTWEPYIYDDMKMAGNAENVDFGKLQGTTITINLSTHDMAAGLTGQIRVLNNTIESSWGKPSHAADIISVWLGQVTKAAIFGY